MHVHACICVCACARACVLFPFSFLLFSFSFFQLCPCHVYHAICIPFKFCIIRLLYLLHNFPISNFVLLLLTVLFNNSSFSSCKVFYQNFTILHSILPLLISPLSLQSSLWELHVMLSIFNNLNVFITYLIFYISATFH